MYKFVTLYRRVDDELMLEHFFNNIHLPLAEKLPGLVQREVSRISHKPGGESRYHLMFELYFHSKVSFEAAMGTPTGIKLIEALMPWAEAKIITWFFADSFEEEMQQFEPDSPDSMDE
ncbi:MAG: EthD family reductase [Chloroflexi bacterium]|nr:EthD family reductase [Chloroflexota bacterium]